MLKLINILLTLLGYLCVATVIATALGLGYMWRTGRLNDEKVFRIVALLQDVDLQQIAEAERKSTDEVPPEEPSIDAVLRRQQVQDRNFEVKLLALQRARQDYDHRLQELKIQTDRFDHLAQDWQSKLNQQAESAKQENLAKVVNQLEQVTPENAKELLMRSINENRMDDAILLMNKMSESKLSKILKTFEKDTELDKLHEIQQRIIGSGAAQLQNAIEQLKPLQPKS